MNITLDDTSPQIEWISTNDTWGIEHSDDPMTPEYFRGTFHGSFTEGDAMRLRCKCSQVSVYGAFRRNHGMYTAQMDDGEVKTMSGFSQDAIIQGLLYSQSGLDPTVEHTLVITNRPSLTEPKGNEYWLDIDYVVIDVAEPGQKVFTTTLDDRSPEVKYNGGGWSTGQPIQPENYHATTAHITQGVNDAVAINWSGHSLALYGGLYFDHGKYTVSLDGKEMGNFDGAWPHIAPGTTMFFVSGLEDGPHEVVLTNIGQGLNGTFIDFDYAQFNSSIDPAIAVASANVTSSTSTPSSTTITTGTSTGTAGTAINGVNTVISRPSPVTSSANITGADSDAATAGTGSNGSGSDTGAIAGGVVGGLAAIALIGALFLWFMRRRRRSNDEEDEYDSRPRVNIPGQEIKPPFDSPNGAQDAYAAAAGYAPYSDYMNTYSSTHVDLADTRDYPSNVSTVPSGSIHSQPTNLPYLSGVPAPPASTATSSPHSINPPSSVGAPETIYEEPDYHVDPFRNDSPNGGSLPSAAFARAVPGVSSVGSITSYVGSVTADSSAPPHTPTGSTMTKAAGVPLPFTARAQSNASTDLSEREAVQGRAMDHGPVGFMDETDEDLLAHDVLPPNYRQATQPLPGQRPPGAATP